MFLYFCLAGSEQQTIPKTKCLTDGTLTPEVGRFYFMTLRDYQVELIDRALTKLEKVNKLCLQLATGGGKTVIFSHIAENYSGRVLILVDAVELVQQTAKTIKGAGTFEAKNKIFPSDRIVIAMSQTIASRAKKNPEIISDFDLVIVDEAHVWVHNKNFDLLKPGCKILGVTATPVRSKRISFFTDSGDEWTREELMSDVYDDIVVGIGIDELIEKEYLVDEELHTIQIDTSKLKEDSSGEFTNDSIAATFENEQYEIDVIAEYERLCKGKKTMIFAPNTKMDLSMYHAFVSLGYPCKMYDSVNSDKSQRFAIVEWFKNTDGAVLFNVGCFTKGFDVTDVQAIILARATASLSLFIQIAGRGARPTQKIYKDRFIFVDGGGNSDRFGMWSAPRDWEKIFWNGFKKPKKKKELLEETKECEECGAIIARHELICEYCGHEEEIKEGKPNQLKDKKTVKNAKLIYPNADKIYRYVKSKNEDVFFALKILNNQILDLFIATNTEKEKAKEILTGGAFLQRLNVIYRPHFRKLIFSDLPSGANRTYQRQVEILKNQITKHYGIN